MELQPKAVTSMENAQISDSALLTVYQEADEALEVLGSGFLISEDTAAVTPAAVTTEVVSSSCVLGTFVSKKQKFNWAIRPAPGKPVASSSLNEGTPLITSDECIPWEVWNIKVNVVSLANEQERQICREKVGEKLGEKIINIVEVMNRHEYLPKMPTQSEVDNVFDTGLKDVQPYLYKISYQITDSLGTSVTTTMRRLIKDTLAL